MPGTHDDKRGMGCAPQRGRGYTLGHLLLNLTGIATFSALWVVYCVHAVRAAREGAVTTWPWIIGAAVLLSLLFADFMSGFVHWAADNWGTSTWPIAGGFVQPFRNHHDDPLDMTRHDLVERHGDNCIVSMPLFFACWQTGSEGGTRLFWLAFWLGTALWILGTNQFHAWAHMPVVPRWVRWLQKTGLILRPEHHAVHHKRPHSDNYCITNGWMSPVLRLLRFYALLEWILTRLSGVLPLHRQRAMEDALLHERSAIGDQQLSAGDAERRAEG